MALEMRIVGRKTECVWSGCDEHAERKKIDGFEIAEWWLSLGYWCNHPDLHEYIIANFANGEDNCDFILLGSDSLEAIIGAVRDRRLPRGSYIFGESDVSSRQVSFDLETLTRAKEWFDSCQHHESRLVYYQAIW